MSEEKKDLKKEAEELGKSMFEAFQAEQEKAKAEEKKAQEEKAKKADKHVSVFHAMRKEYGISSSTFDKMVENDFSPNNVKQYVGFQKDSEMAERKSNLFWRAAVGAKIYPHEPAFSYTLKALSEGTNADGGFLVNPEFRGEVLRQLHHEGIMRPEVNVIPTTKDAVEFNAEDGRPTTSWGSENTSISTTTAGLSQTTINVHRLNTLMYLSREVVADSDPAITEWIRDEFTTAMRLAEDAAIIGGSGSGQPQGITGLSGLSSNAAGSTLSFEDYLDLEHTLPIQYRRTGNVKWFMNDLALRDARKLKDDQGMPILQRDLTGRAPDTLLGYPVVVHNTFSESTIFFGDLKRTYILLDRQQMSVETTTEGGDTFAKHQLGMKVTERIGGNAVRTEALVTGTGYSA